MFAKSMLAAALVVAILSPPAAMAGGLTICNSLGGGSRVCTNVGDDGATTATENSLGGGTFVGRDTNGGAWMTSPLGRGSSVITGDPPGFMSEGD
jgi:hypothetical protein